MSLELMTSHVVVDLILHCHWSATMLRGLIFHRLAMLHESESEMSAHKSVVRSSSQPNHTTLHAHLCVNQSTNLPQSSKRITNAVCVGYTRRLPMVTKALRSVL